MTRRKVTRIGRSLAFMRKIVQRLSKAFDSRGIPGFRQRRRHGTGRAA